VYGSKDPRAFELVITVLLTFFVGLPVDCVAD